MGNGAEAASVGGARSRASGTASGSGRLASALGILAILAAWAVLRWSYRVGYYLEDAPLYVSEALWVLQGEWVPRDFVNHLYLATYFPVAAMIGLLGKTELALMAWPALCSLVGTLSVAGCAWTLAGRACGILAGVLYAVYPGDVFFATVVMPDGLQPAWLALAVFLGLRASRRPRSGGLALALASGVAFGICFLARKNALVLLPVLLATAWLDPKPRPLRDRLLHWGLALGGFALVLAGEGAFYAWKGASPLLGFQAVSTHYGSADAIRKWGLSTDPQLIPESLFAPLLWLRGKSPFGALSISNGYHGMHFAFAALAGLFWAAAALARGKAGRELGFALFWAAWPVLYHQFGTQSLSEWVPIHRQARHLVLYAPGAVVLLALGLRRGLALVRPPQLEPSGTAPRARWRAFLIVSSAAASACLYYSVSGLDLVAERVRAPKESWRRIAERLRGYRGTVYADFETSAALDFLLNPVGERRVSVVAYLALESCEPIREGIVAVDTGYIWWERHPVLLEALRKLPCLGDPPASWKLLPAPEGLEGPERLFLAP